MSKHVLKVPKTLKGVKLWVHPEGPVLGALFLHEHSPNRAGPEDPAEVLNRESPFVAVRREAPEELRFYNRSAIIRVEYEAVDEPELPDATSIDCRIQMMDGSVIDGTIRESLAPDRARLFDYLNNVENRFIKMLVEPGLVYLVNKAYIVHATDVSE